ncbi:MULTISPECIES: zinc ribbon domain-containing protein [Serratia]|jgi:hypothetical protein|uniref:ORC-CDC6 family AAA ATPase n=1 Tax=Serratia TaxID=613 RepID=UPI0021CA8FC6|nr:zinc ribbon domain-containing protein [Serratia liquefaciens]EKN4905985.1 zinc ribbon domain-containing protein [Yersinia enterocolitica]HDM8374050.1 zinc ribbon domain-containing protein [Yersinia enterocolitica]HEN3244246.1 zinc ribbon domain-containing protein [Yersinia enterocolitica]HEN3450959.1 zinc ribbon domain-containing protein [Yersinia enterocolitica]HEN5458107.1 zinc ribbon domain-containing protein [Yersinia enterocolitica]
MNSNSTDNNFLNISIVEERADYLDENEIKNNTMSAGTFFMRIHTSLIEKGTVLLEGPRGCGKTHLMRYSWLHCKENNDSPLGIYVSFNKYFRLEPLLRSKPNAIILFNTWCLAKILISSYDIASEIEDDDNLDLSSILLATKESLNDLVNRLEQGLAPSNNQEELVEKISVSSVTNSIHTLTEWLERKRAIIFLDDAAITLTPEYLHEFFDIVRTLKTNKIALKASVYPGTTEYGPKFHVAHEANIVSAWISTDSENYAEIMESIATLRFNEYNLIPSDIRELLKFAAFGIPRSFLMMLREYHDDSSKNKQQIFNRIIEKYANVRMSEYRSLKDKMPRLEAIINIGELLLDKILDAIKQSNSLIASKNEKQVIVGIEKIGSSLSNRMINLLVEVGMLYKLQPVSHGEDRSYDRYIPHYALLIKEKVFNESSQGFSPTQIIDYINRKNSKHPVRRSLKSLIGDDAISNIRLTLPPCTKCETLRLSDNQKFCHQCGSKLVDESSFNRCMSFELSTIPQLTAWQSKKIKELENIKTVGDILSIQDPGTELRKLNRVGLKRADNIIQRVMFHVDEYLS